MSTTFSLRPLRSDDSDWIYEACQDLEIQKWTQIPRPYTREHAVSFATTLSGDVEVWVIESNSGEKPYGVIGVHSINPATRIADIGYWCAPWGRRKGAIKNGLQLFIEKMRNRKDVGAIQATIAEPNIASRKTVETVGFTLLGSADRNCNCGGEDISAVLYEITLKTSLL